MFDHENACAADGKPELKGEEQFTSHFIQELPSPCNEVPASERGCHECCSWSKCALLLGAPLAETPLKTSAIALNSDRELAYSFAAWRVQGAVIAHSLKMRRRKRDEQQLCKILALLDRLWCIDLGDAYPEELSKVIEAHNAGMPKTGCPEVQI